MDIKDFRKLVDSCAFKEKLNGFNITLNYEHLHFTVELKGVQSIYKFVYEQVIGWNKTEIIPPYFLTSKMHFEVLKSSLISIANYTDTSYEYNFDNELKQLQRDLNNLRGNRNDFIFIYDVPETDFLKAVYKKNNLLFNGALDYLTNSTINIRNDNYYLTGLLMAYEFKNQGETEIPKRRNSEKLSLAHIRSKYNEYLVEAEQQLNSNLSDAKENLTNHFETVDSLKNEKNNNF